MRLDFTVPTHTTYGYQPPESHQNVAAHVLAGASYTFRLLFNVAGGNTAPPDGTQITLRLADNARGVTLRPLSAVVRRTPPLNLQLSTEQGTVAPGDTFTYTLTCANISTAPRNGVTLRASVPEGATFISADGGGRLIGGVVNWTLGTLTAGDDRQLHATFRASATDNTPLGPVKATLTDNSGHVARASDTRAVYAMPEIEYMIATPTARVEPGHLAEFNVRVHNPSGLTQYVRLDFTVPEFTTYGYQPPETPQSVATHVAAGAEYNFQLLFNVAGGNMAPPEGTIITLNVIDVARAGSISRTIELGFLSPNITTDPATNPAAYSATLNGTVDPHGLSTSVHFEVRDDG